MPYGYFFLNVVGLIEQTLETQMLGVMDIVRLAGYLAE